MATHAAGGKGKHSPETFIEPWTLENSLWRTDELIFEAACHEGNIGLAAILSGARAQEKR